MGISSSNPPLTITDGMNFLAADAQDVSVLQSEICKSVWKQLETREESIEETVERAWKVIARRGSCELSDLCDSVFLEKNPVTRVYIEAREDVGLDQAGKIMFASYISNRDCGDFVLVYNGAHFEDELNPVMQVCKQLDCLPTRLVDIKEVSESCMNLCEAALDQGVAYLECPSQECRGTSTKARFQRFISERTSCCLAVKFRCSESNGSDPQVLIKQVDVSSASAVKVEPLLALAEIDRTLGTFRVISSGREASHEAVYWQLKDMLQDLHSRIEGGEIETKLGGLKTPIFFPVPPLVETPPRSAERLPYDFSKLFQRGMRAEGFKSFASQLYLKSETSDPQPFDESALWSPNYNFLAKTAPMLRAIRQDSHGIVVVRNYDDVIPDSLPLSEAVPLNSMNQSGGTKQLVRPRLMWMNEFDIESMNEDDDVYLKDWGVFRVVSMNYDNEEHVRAIVDFSFEERISHNLKEFLWVTGSPDGAVDSMVELEMIFRKRSRNLSKGTGEEERRIKGWGESAFQALGVGDFVYVEGMGMFLVSSKSKTMNSSSTQDLVELVSVPSGRAISMD
eukprot:768342-Hanusia_phi.AAC.1